MCGIILGINHGKNEENVNDWVINQLEDQISRGSQGFGITFVDDKGVAKTLRSTEMTKAMIDLYMNPSKFIMVHHRIPTSSQNKIKQTHPIVVDNLLLKHKYLVIHNGILYNEDKLKEEHERLGFKYTTEYMAEDGYEKDKIKFNDSESVAIELALLIEKKISQTRIRGSVATIVLQCSKKNNKVLNVFYYRNTNPIKLSKTRGKIRLSSEGEGEQIKADSLYQFNLKDYKIHRTNLINDESAFEDKDEEITNKAKEIIDYNTGYPAKDYDDYDESDRYGYNRLYSSDGSGKWKRRDYPEDTDDNVDEDIDVVMEMAEEEHGQVAQSLIQEFFERLSSRDTLMTMNPNEEIKGLLREIAYELTSAYNMCKDACVDNTVEAAINLSNEKLMANDTKKTETQKTLSV